MPLKGLVLGLALLLGLLSCASRSLPTPSGKVDPNPYIIFDGPQWFVLGMGQEIGLMRDNPLGEWYFQWMTWDKYTIRHWPDAPGGFVVGYTDKAIWIGQGIPTETGIAGAMIAVAATYIIQAEYQPACPSPWRDALAWSVGATMAQLMNAPQYYQNYLKEQKISWQYQIVGQIPVLCPLLGYGHNAVTPLAQ